MQLKPDGTFERNDIWREGEYLDLWSVPHFLSGILVGLTLFFLGFSRYDATVIAVLLLCAYEIFEYVAGIDETRSNAILDVVVGVASCVPALYYAPLLPREDVIAAYVALGAADAVLSFLGWGASRKASVLERKLRAEWQHERAAMRKRRLALERRLRRRPLI